MSCGCNGLGPVVVFPPCPPTCPPVGLPVVTNINLAGFGFYDSSANGALLFRGIEGGTGIAITYDATNKAYQFALNAANLLLNGASNTLSGTTGFVLNGNRFFIQQSGAEMQFSDAGVAFNQGDFTVNTGTSITITNGAQLNLAGGGLLSVSGVLVSPGSILVTGSTAGQLTPTLITNFLSDFNLQVGYTVSSASAPNRTLNDGATLSQVISYVVTLTQDIMARRLPHT